ncbi:MAG: TlpA family protein disulfide reductase [Flavobacteriales bacterium]|nr:TlpA family protein disulfide reductase [Flavobacteriales bacterium]
MRLVRKLYVAIPNQSNMRILLTTLLSFLLIFPGSDSSSASALQSNGIRVGDKAPEIEMASPDGKMIKLSSLRGQVVLIDFWASWCGPCRRENPNVVRVYKKYNKAKFKTAKGFEIFSVSLDANPKAWQEAIQRDGLIWNSHVSDLKKWRNEAAQTYGVRSIPSSYLIDANGVVIAKNLRGNQLDLELDKLIKGL